MYKLTRDYSKEPLKRGELIPKADLIELYITHNLDRHEAGKVLGVSDQPVRRALVFYGISKSIELQRKKAGATCLKKYGVENPLQSKVIRCKTIETTKKRYGVDNPFKLRAVQKKAQETIRRKYGKDFAGQVPEIQAKRQATIKAKYGAKTGMQCHMKHLPLYNDDNQFSDFVKAGKDGRKWYTAELAEYFNCSTSTMQVRIGECDLWYYIEYKISKEEGEVRSAIEAMGITTTRYKKGKLEVDIYIPSMKIGVEFNGNYWHSTRTRPDYKYHLKKSQEAEKQGIFLYHVFEYDWLRNKGKIISQLRNLLGKNTEKIFARKCTLQEVDPNTAHKFLDANHLQGRTASKCNLGLYYNGELVSLMTFGKSRFNKNVTWELVRFCNKAGCSVTGAASKLFKHFIATYDPDTVISYSDIAHTKGTIYDKLGFKLTGLSAPNYVWVYHDIVLSRYQCQKNRLIAQGFKDKGNTEVEIMTNRHYSQIYDCGCRVHVWAKQ